MAELRATLVARSMAAGCETAASVARSGHDGSRVDLGPAVDLQTPSSRLPELQPSLSSLSSQATVLAAVVIVFPSYHPRRRALRRTLPAITVAVDLAVTTVKLFDGTPPAVVVDLADAAAVEGFNGPSLLLPLPLTSPLPPLIQSV